jgi:capsular polysaccharide biosynthesis protein
MEDIAQAILRRFRVILLVVLVFLGATLGVTFWQTPVYEASAKLVMGQKRVPPGSDLVKPPAPTAEGLQEPARSVVEAIDSRLVAEEVIQRLGLRMEHSELVENLSVEQEASPGFLQLSYKDTDPERAQLIVNTVGVVSSELITEEIGRAKDVVVTMWEDASVPSTPVSPDPVRDGLLALVLGLAAGIGLALLIERRAT